MGMIFRIPTRRCQDCGSMLKGRMDKKFCNDVCRVRQHRKIHVHAKTVKSVERVLIRNRSLLVTLKEKGRATMTGEGRFVWLRRQGFDFNFHTHVQPLDDGRLAIMCFEEGYILQGEGLISWSDFPNNLISRLPA